MVEATDQNLPDYESDNEEKTAPNKNPTKVELNQQGYAGMHFTSFKDFLLKPELLRAIQDAGFEHPSEVQQECLPKAITGSDILCQAKSGMGKTAVFVLAILNQLSKDSAPNSTMILCHTRELAFQISNEVQRLGKYLPEIKCQSFLGGDDLMKQKDDLEKNKPTIFVGTPGRTLHLLRKKYVSLENVKFFIIDECDKVLSQLDMRKDVQEIFKETPHTKQVMMFSATIGESLRPTCKKFMQKPFEVFIDDESKLRLDGLHQYYVNLKESEKTLKLTELLDALVFNQVIVFVKTKERASTLNKILMENKFPSIAIHSELKQEERIKVFKEFKEFKARILVSTDLCGRGIDIPRINIVINYDFPENSDTYLHRVARCARFGTKGLAITFTSDENDKKILKEVQDRFVYDVKELPESIDTSQYMNN